MKLRLPAAESRWGATSPEPSYLSRMSTRVSSDTPRSPAEPRTTVSPPRSAALDPRPGRPPPEVAARTDRRPSPTSRQPARGRFPRRRPGSTRRTPPKRSCRSAVPLAARAHRTVRRPFRRGCWWWVACGPTASRHGRKTAFTLERALANLVTRPCLLERHRSPAYRSRAGSRQSRSVRRRRHGYVRVRLTVWHAALLCVRPRRCASRGPCT